MARVNSCFVFIKHLQNLIYNESIQVLGRWDGLACLGDLGIGTGALSFCLVPLISTPSASSSSSTYPNQNEHEASNCFLDCYKTCWPWPRPSEHWSLTAREWLLRVETNSASLWAEMLIIFLFIVSGSSPAFEGSAIFKYLAGLCTLQVFCLEEGTWPRERNCSPPLGWAHKAIRFLHTPVIWNMNLC